MFRNCLKLISSPSILIRPKLMNVTSIAPKFLSTSNVKKNDEIITSKSLSDLKIFLDEEIDLEKQQLTFKAKDVIPNIEGFRHTFDGANVVLTKETSNESIVVNFNINSSVDADQMEGENEDDLNDVTTNQQTQQQTPDGQQQNNQEPIPDMKSRPTFTVDIKKTNNGKVLSFVCSFLPQEFHPTTDAPEGTPSNQQLLAPEDFQIDELTVHDGEWNEKTYSTDGAVLDGNLYDKLLSVLEERGIGEQFANSLANFSTAYEHLQYVRLLEKLREFSS
ncbi:hypothetical protein SNEBB_001667 [Seison nebaliae]|nr:hypothetical protein SNEBB_001667 [Seison nebaliae]